MFTPNGDNKNENTVVEFTLARVAEPQDLEITILDLSGRVVRELDTGQVRGGQYVRPPAGRDPSGVPGYWDGKDGEDNLVPPGIYLVRVRAVLGREERVQVRPVAVAY